MLPSTQQTFVSALMVLEGFSARTKVVLVKKERRKASERERHVYLPGTSMHFKYFPLIGMKIENHSVHRCTGRLFFSAAFACLIWECL